MRTIAAALLLCTTLFIGCKENKKTEIAIEDQSTNSSSGMDDITSANLEIFPIEHASAVLKWGDITIFVDPVGSADSYSAYPSPNMILITDIHGDHLSQQTLEGIDTSNTRIIVPQAVADQIREQMSTQFDVLNNGDSKVFFGVSVEAIPMYNLREEAKSFHTKGRGNGYVLTLGEERVYFSGDTEDIPEMRALKNIDKAFVCMNLPYTMTVDNAAEAVLEFKPKEVYPYHFRGRPDVSDVSRFAELVNAENAAIEVVQLDWYPNDPY
ncbi:MAG: MBL fold metallo-hydrolase [Eudoraea sp.]|nr:MBL fold metallo-hydrolase [Eudoraea sp.]